MDSAKIRAALAVVEMQPTPNGYKAQIDEKTGEIEYYFMWWFNPDRTIKYVAVSVKPTTVTVLIDTQRRLWVPLENIKVIVNPTHRESHEPIGQGGHHYISFDDRLHGGPIDGLKEALNTALTLLDAV